MKKVAVLIRVYDRIEDLKYNLQIIKDLWNNNDYDVFVSSNGKSSGYKIDDETSKNIFKLIELEENAGHLKGNSQLLLEGCKNIPFDNYDYLIILEADTWIMDDSIITKYIKNLDSSQNVWASAEWVESRHSLAVDFAIIKSKFIKEYYSHLFDFTTKAEMWIAENLNEMKKEFTYINEFMPIHRPSAVKSIYNADEGRLRVFPLAKTVTHHIENLEGGMDKKKELANLVSKSNYFENKKNSSDLSYYLYILLQFSLRSVPRSSWIKKKKTTFNLETKELV